MGEGLQFATLAALVGKKFGARWGTRRVTIGAVGFRDGERFVMGTFADGSVVLGEPGDFSVPTKRPRATNAVDPIGGSDHKPTPREKESSEFVKENYGLGLTEKGRQR